MPRALAACALALSVTGVATIARAQDDATETPARSILEDDSDESTSETEEPVELSPTAPADETGESRIRTALETETETTLDPTVPAGEEDETAGARATPPADEMTEGAEPPPLVEGDATAEPLTDPDLAVDPLIESEAEEKAAGDVAEKHHEVISEQREVLEEIEDAAAETQVAVALPEPCTGPWDWVHYSSGEWLRGEFKRMRKKSFELQSTRFDRRTSDWKHIRGFCFKASSRFILYDHTVLVGQGRLENGVLTVTSGDVTQTARRSDIWVILPGTPTEINRWRSTTSVGIDAYTGNTDQASVTASATIDREDPSSHLHLEYTGTFNQADGEVNAARHRASQKMNVYFTRVLYASLPFVDYTSDRFQNLQHRVVPGLSLGVKIFDFDWLDWNLDGGLAYQYTQYTSVQPGQDLTENDWGPRVSTRLDWDIVTDLTFEAQHQTVLLVREFGQTNYHTRFTLTYDVTDLIFIEAAVWHDRVRDPQETLDGTIPDKDDLRYIFSLGLNFD